MPEITHGIRKVLSHAGMYRWFQELLRKDGRSIFVEEYLRLNAGVRVWDIGCGEGDLLRFIGTKVEYVGIDRSQKYIAAAEKRYGNRGRFICVDVADLDCGTLGLPNVVVIKGLLHHLSDIEVDGLLERIADVVDEKTRIITVDPCLTEKMNQLARLVISMDRGQNVRSPQGYLKLAKRHFQGVQLHIRTDFLRIPYCHAVMIMSHADRAPAMSGGYSTTSP